MSAFDWLYQIVVEGLKYIILGHWFFGFSFSRKKTRFWLAAYLLVIPVVEYVKNPYVTFLGYYAWGLLLLLCVFEGEVVKRIKAFFIMWFLIAMVDAVIMTVFVIFMPKQIMQNNEVMEKVVGCIGLGIWGLIIHKTKEYVSQFWNRISKVEYIFVLIVFSVVSLMLGGIQSYLYNTINVTIKSTAFISGVAIAGILLIVLGLLLYTKQSKKRLEQVNQLNIRYFQLQKRYYETALEQYEDMRRFRHDLNHHIFMLSQLCEKDHIEELKEYIGKMSETYESMKTIHTGNFVADCIISRTVQELQKSDSFTFEFDGQFWENSIMDEIELCALLSNLLDNAKEALLQVEGEKLLQMEVKRFQDRRYLIIRNTTKEGAIDFDRTDKEDNVCHGYGIQNVKRIVEKYHGTVSWSCLDQMVEVKICFRVDG